MPARNLLFAFAIGAVAAHWLPALHALAAPLLCSGVGLLPIRRLRLAAAALLGLGWAGCHAVAAVAQLALPCAASGLVGRVVGLPAAQWIDGVGAMQRFAFELETAQCRLAARRRVQLSWLRGPAVRGGERWRLEARLRPPRGTVNRHGFDFERLSVHRETAALGYVLAGRRLEPPQGVALFASTAGIDALRQRLRGALGRLHLAKGPVLAALTVGDGSAVAPEEMARYRRTGTLHLLVVSGLHVGIVTALGFLLGRGIGRVVGVAANTAGVALALVLAAAYLLLAGAGLSVLRATVMSAAALLALAAGRTSPPSAIFACALAAVLLLDPLAPLAAGFWLSFGAVAALVGFFACRPGWRSKVRGAFVAQLVMVAAFAPAVVVLTGLLHPLGLVVNLVAVPAVSLAVLPLALAGVALLATPLGPWLLIGADFAMTVVDTVLAVSDRLPPVHVADIGAWWIWLVLVGGACLLPVARLALLALGSAAAVVLLPPLLARTALPAGQVRLTVLDVGQGTAALVETAHHRLLYDAGPSFLTGGDMGDRVVLPALRGLGYRRLDLVVVSHADLDHAGGVSSVVAEVAVGGLLGGEAVPGLDVRPCTAGTKWRWDGVEFAVLAPPAGHRRRGNDASCVLLIDTGRARALLPGDIERGVEAQLALSAVDFLLLPHHGSATSSSPGFVAAARPRIAVVANGFGNRFGHPHPTVVARYRAAGAHIVSTAVSGALVWRSDRAATVAASRCRQADYWRLAGGTDVARLLPCG